MEYLCKYYRVEILQGWCAARTTHCDSGYDVTIATYSLPDLYNPRMKNALFYAPEFNTLSSACAVFAHSQWMNNKIKWHFLKEENSDFRLSLERAWSPLCCHGNVTVDISWNFVMSATTVLFNCKFQLYTGKVARDIKFVVIFYTTLCSQNDVTSHLRKWF